MTIASNHPLLEKVLPIVAKAFGLTVEKLLSRDRETQECNARKVAAWILHQRGFCLRECSESLKRGRGCANMLKSWIEDVNLSAYLLQTAKTCNAQISAVNPAEATQATGIEAMVCKDIAERQAMGIAKYGTTVADNPAEHAEWLRHAYTEALDFAIYLRRAMEAVSAPFN